MSRILHNAAASVIFFIWAIGAYATPPGFPVQLVGVLPKNNISKDSVVQVLTKNSDLIREGVGRLYKELPIAVPNSKALQSPISVKQLELLFDQSSVDMVQTDAYGSLNKIYLLEPGTYLKVLIPVVKKDTDYKKTKQGVLVRVDKFVSCDSALHDAQGKLISRSRTIKEDAIYASKLCLFVGKDGKLYGGFTVPWIVNE